MYTSPVSSLEVGSKVSLKLYGNTKHTVLSNATLISKSSHHALRNVNEVITMNSNIYPTIPDKVESGLSADYKKYIYLIFQLEDGTVIEIAQCWIDPNTVVVSDSNRTTIEIVNLVPEDLNTIKALFNQLGISEYRVWEN